MKSNIRNIVLYSFLNAVRVIILDANDGIACLFFKRTGRFLKYEYLDKNKNHVKNNFVF